MKRILSIIVTLSIIVSAISVALLSPVSASQIDSGFYSADNTPVFEAPTSGTAKWLTLDNMSAQGASIGTSTTDGRNTIKDGPAVTTPILAANKAAKTDIQSFAWQFDFASVGQLGDNLASFFLFHVNKDSNYTALSTYTGEQSAANAGVGLKDVNNVFAISYATRTTADGIKGGALTVLQPTFDENGNSLGLRPVAYNEQEGNIVPTVDSYLAVPTNSSQFNRNSFATFSVTLQGNSLTLSVVQNNLSISKTFTLSETALAAAPSGDFVVTASKRSSGTGNCAHFRYMSVTEIDYTPTPVTFERAEDITAIAAPPIRLEYYNKTSDSYKGYVDVRDGKLVMVGRRDTSETTATDTTPLTKGITQQQLEDFTIKYVYNAGADGWIRDGIIFHTDSETPGNDFSVVIQGKSYGDKYSSAIVAISKGRVGADFNTDVLDGSTGVYTYDSGVFTKSGIAVKTDYYVEITVKGKKVDVYIYKTNTSRPTEPTLSWEDDSVDSTSGDIAFTARQVGSTFTKFTVTDDTNGKTICSNYTPALYNGKAYTHYSKGQMSSFVDTGSVAYTAQGYRIYAKSDLTGLSKAVTTNLIKPQLNAFCENYKLTFDYIPNIASGTTSVLLNSSGTVANSQLILNITDNSTIELVETLSSGTNTVAAVSQALTVGKAYSVEIEKTSLGFKLWVYEKESSKPIAPTLSGNLSEMTNTGAVYFHTENGDFTVNNIKLTSTDGYVDVRDGKFIIAGKTSSMSDVVIRTKGITGSELTSFTAEYTYSTTRTDWNRNILMINVDSESPTFTDNMYSLTMQGTNGTGAEQEAMSIVRNGSLFKSTNAASTGSMKMQDGLFAANTEYRIKVKVDTASSTISAWLCKNGEEFATEPTVTYTHSSIANSSGDIAFACRANAFMISDLTVIDDVSGNIICQNYSPLVYNDSEITTSYKVDNLQTSGMVTYTKSGYRINALSDFDSVVRPVSTAALPMGDIYGNFELSVDYRANNSGTNKLLFNSTGASGSGFSLVLPTDSASKITLCENGSEIASVDNVLTIGKFYTIDVIREDYGIKVYIYQKGSTKPTNPTLSYTDSYPLGKGDIYFYTANGDFTLGSIDLTVTDTQSESDVITSEHTVYSTGRLTFEKSSADGIVNFVNGRVTVQALSEINPDTGKAASTWVTSKGITGKKLQDFTVKYSYYPATTGWGIDAVVLRTNDSESVDRTKGYSFGIQGKSHKIDGEANDKSSVWIQNGSTSAISKSTVDSTKAAWTEIDDITLGQEYIVEITVKGSTVSAWFYKADSQKPTEPTLTYTDPDAKYTSGDIAFVARDEGFSAANITVTDNTNNTTVTDSYNPVIYSSFTGDFATMSATTTFYKTGNVNMSNGELHIFSNNSISDTTYPVVTNVLENGGSKYFNNFELCFVANFADMAQNKADIHFNNYLYGSEYKLTLDKGNSKVEIYKGDTLVATADYDFKVGLEYQVILSKADGKTNVYVYKVGGTKPAALLTYTDSDPLPEGNIFFGTENGDFTLSDIALKVTDADIVGNPFYELDFEDGMGDAVFTYGNSQLVTEGDNTYLSVTRDDSGDGRSTFVFGPQEIGNFTLNMHIRITENTNSRWFYLGLRHHTNGDTLNKFYESQIFNEGSAIAAIDPTLKYTNTNHKLGLSGATPKDVPNPRHDYNCGIHVDGEWHKVSVVSDGYLISIYIDGKLIVQAQDPEQLFAKGGFALYSWGANYDVDNIRIYSEPYYALENDLIQLGPTGLLFQKDFEDDDRNMDGLTLTQGTPEKTVIMTEENGNSFLRVVGKRTKDPTDFSGIDALSRIHFGSNYIRNFDFSAKVRFKSAFSANWSYLTVAVRADFSNYQNNAIWMNIGPRGSAVVMKNTDLGFTTTNNVVASTGLITGTGQTAFMPNTDRDCGIPLDGQWHDIKVTGRGHTFTLYIDSKEIISYTDPNQTFDRGAVYLYGYGVNYDLDDILITNYDAYTPKTEPINTTVYTNNEGYNLVEKQVTGELLSTAGIKDSELSSFTWQFDYKAGSSNWGRTTFMYHATDDAEILDSAGNYSNNKNIFGITITGTNINTKTGKENVVNNLQNNAITVFSPNQDVLSEKEILPVLYDPEAGVEVNPKNIPRAASYLSLAATKTQPAIEVGEWMTVKMQLIGNNLAVSVWQTDNKKATFRRQIFTIPSDAIESISKGDFVISNGDNKASIKNIVISNQEIVKMKASVPTATVTPVGTGLGQTSPATGDSADLTTLKLILTLNALIVGCSALVLFTYNKATGKHSR